jgi:KipI family sensor histidine kinase inhibitor
MVSLSESPASPPDPIIRPAGDQALVVEFSETIDPRENARVLNLDSDLAAHPVQGVLETAPTYRSLLVRYDPRIVNGRELAAVLVERSRTVASDLSCSRIWHVPVLYGHEAGLDLVELAEMKDLTTDEVIAAHAGATYRIYMIGFTPGYAYLGGLPGILHTPRLKKPRQLTPAGGVAIGGMQACVASVASPSGWRYIGRTPLRSFDPRRATPFVFRTGDSIRFHRISQAEAERLDRLSENGEIVAELA